MIITVSKGQQITIPSAMRKNLSMEVGSKVELIRKGKNIVIRPIDEDLRSLFEQARKIKPKHNFTAKQMDEVVEREIRGQ